MNTISQPNDEVSIIEGFDAPDPDGTKRYNHGLAWSPDEQEAWVAEGNKAYVFDMSNPLKPRQTHEMTYTSSSSEPGESSPSIDAQVAAGIVAPGNVHWITFSIDGVYAYLASIFGTTEVWDAKTKKFVQ